MYKLNKQEGKKVEIDRKIFIAGLIIFYLINKYCTTIKYVLRKVPN